MTEPEPHARRRPRAQAYHTPYEVAQHNTPTDCWVSLLGGVYNVTRLLRDNPGPRIAPLLAAAGTDISHWFDTATGDVRMHVHPVTQLSVPYCPQGVFLHVPPVEPTTDYDCNVETPWWRDITLRVGLLSSCTRLVRIKNVLTEQEDTLEVPSEETVAQLQERYLLFNAHAASYTWKALAKAPGGAQAAAPSCGSSASSSGAGSCWEFRELHMSKTLAENGVVDEAATFEALDLASDHHVPVLHVYWVDDLTAA